MNIKSINISLNGYNNFTASAPRQRSYAINSTFPTYTRMATLTQDVLTCTYYTTSVQIPLTQIWSVVISASSTLTPPPIISSQPSGSVVTHPSASYFSVVASAETPMSYQWASSSYLQSISNPVTWSMLTNSVNGYSGSQTPFLTDLTTAVVDNGSQYACIISNLAGALTSSVATLTVS